MATSPDDVCPEYDFRAMRGVTRGKHAARAGRVVRLADDVAAAFADDAAVNDVLRDYLRQRGAAGPAGSV